MANPEGAVRVQYADNIAGGAINTEITLDPSTYEYETKFSLISAGTFSLAYNSWSGSNQIAMIGVGSYNIGRINTNMMAGYSSSSGTNVGWTYNTVIEMSLHGTVLTYNGATYAMTRPTSGIKPKGAQPIFGTRQGLGTTEVPQARFWYCKIWTDANTLALDLIPVRVGDKCYLLDRVGNALLGDGSLVAGPDAN